jgi:hypothetical protein
MSQDSGAIILGFNPDKVREALLSGDLSPLTDSELWLLGWVQGLLGAALDATKQQEESEAPLTRVNERDEDSEVAREQRCIRTPCDGSWDWPCGGCPRRKV